MDNTAEQTGNVAEETSTQEVESTPAENVDTQDVDGNVSDSEQQVESENAENPEEVKLDINSIKIPEGISVSDEDKAKFSEFAEQFGFKSQDNLQNFFDWVVKTRQEGEALEAKEAEEFENKWKEIRAGWKESLVSDPDFGKEYDLNVKRANDTIVKFGGTELAKFLKENNFDENPLLVKCFARIGKEISDPKLLSGKSSAGSEERPRDSYNQPMIKFKDL